MARAAKIVLGLMLAVLAVLPGMLGMTLAAHIIIPIWRSGAWELTPTARSVS